MNQNMASKVNVRDDKKRNSKERCPLCNIELNITSNNRLLCKNCQTVWIINPETGIVKFANLYLNRKQ